MGREDTVASDVKYIHLRVVGGENPGASLSQRLGPLGVSLKAVSEDVVKVTSNYIGLRVHVRLAVKDKKVTVEVTPSTATLVIKALGEPPRSKSDRKKEKNILHNGSLRMDDVLEIARFKRKISFSKSFAGIVKEVLGTCKSVGCRVDGKCPFEVIREINTEKITLPS